MSVIAEQVVRCASCGWTVDSRDAEAYTHRVGRFKTVTLYRCQTCHRAWRPVWSGYMMVSGE